MIKIAINICLFALLLLQGNAAFAQSTAQPTVDDARVEQLARQDPATLVSEAAYERPWPMLKESNIAWKSRMWRIVDTREQQNIRLADIGTAHAGLAAVLIKGVLSGRYKAYTHSDDRFFPGMTPEAFKAQLTNDTTKPGATFDPALITKFRLKEDWMYIASEKKLVCRIIGIAPVREVVAADGTVSDQLMFWLYYPSMREYLVEQELNSSGGSAKNLDELFEARQYGGVIEQTREYAKPTPEGKARTLRIERMMEQQQRAEEKK